LQYLIRIWPALKLDLSEANLMGPVELTAIIGVCVFLIVAAIVGLFASPGRKRCGSGKVKDLRTIRRFAKSDKVTLSWRGANNVTQTLKCHLIDISENSAGVRSKLAFDLGTHLYTSIPALRLATTANVRRCSAAGWKFDLGLEFQGPLYRDCHSSANWVIPPA
jgi:hypothetical protein